MHNMIELRSQAKLVISMAMLFIGLSACGHLDSESRYVPVRKSKAAASNTPRIKPGPGHAKAIVHRAHSLLGVPYRYGGSSPEKGMDCSGLIYYLHRQQGQRVPRSTRHQFQQSNPVRKANLKPGDLVFFRLERKIAHVGLYIGNGMFIHAPSSGKHVQRSSLSDPYWRQRWVRGGRFN